MRRTKLEKNILFLDEDNACLSLMAESMAKHRSLPKIRIFSAGIRPGQIPPEVRKVLQEIGVEQSAITTKSVDQIPANDIDLVVSFGDAHEQCRSLPSKAKVEKWSIPNPMRAPGESLSEYRRGRDEIDKRVAALLLDHWRHVV
jgi:arsenate reductase (thioredoxin)